MRKFDIDVVVLHRGCGDRILSPDSPSSGKDAAKKNEFVEVTREKIEQRRLKSPQLLIRGEVSCEQAISSAQCR